jgi:hypothetical protein
MIRERAIRLAVLVLLLALALLAVRCGRAPHVHGSCLPGGFERDGTTPCPIPGADADAGTPVEGGVPTVP